MEEKNTNGNGDSKIRKVLFNELTLGIALVGVISSFIFWVVNPQQELKLQITRLESQIENNQTVTAQLEKIKNNDFVELQLKLDQLEERQINILESLAAIKQQLELHNK